MFLLFLKLQMQSIPTEDPAFTLDPHKGKLVHQVFYLKFVF